MSAVDSADQDNFIPPLPSSSPAEKHSDITHPSSQHSTTASLSEEKRTTKLNTANETVQEVDNHIGDSTATSLPAQLPAAVATASPGTNPVGVVDGMTPAVVLTKEQGNALLPQSQQQQRRQRRVSASSMSSGSGILEFDVDTGLSFHPGGALPSGECGVCMEERDACSSLACGCHCCTV